MAKLFKYHGRERTVESVMRRAQSAGKSFDTFIDNNVPTFKPKEGENCVRILPAEQADWDLQVHIHYNVGPDNATYLCLAKMKNEDCPVCTARAEATDEEEKSAMRISERRLVWVVDRDNEKAGPLIWSMPASLYKDICGRQIDKKSGEIIYLDDPEDGYDIVFNREGQQLRTKYTGVEISREATPLNDNAKTQDRWLEYIAANPLPSMLTYYDADYIERILMGRSRVVDPADEDVELRPRRGKAPVADEEEDPKEEERRPRRRVEPAEEEEEPTVRRGRAGNGHKEEPPEEEEETPEEEDEKPATRRAGGPLGKMRDRRALR